MKNIESDRERRKIWQEKEGANPKKHGNIGATTECPAGTA
jgi:hypothetical protein